MIKILKEGPGAGYTVSGKLMYDPEIKKFTIVNKSDDFIELDCDINGELADVEAYAYYDGGNITEFVPVKITYIKLQPIYDDDVKLDKFTLRDALDNIKFETHIGGGWSHTLFDGDLSTDDIKDNHYTSFYVLEIGMHITDNKMIQYIDDVVTGEVVEEVYSVYSDWENLGDFETSEEAIEYAESNPDALSVNKLTTIRRYDGEYDAIDDEVIWERR